jgi:predicted dienelactone hydrolase
VGVVIGSDRDYQPEPAAHALSSRTLETPMLPARRLALGALLAVFVSPSAAQTNRIDTVTPMAPELAAYGNLSVGVRTLQAVDRNRPDVLNTKEGGPIARYDRLYTLEVWYPATLAPGQADRGDYAGVLTRDPAVVVTLHGRAVRDATPRPAEGGYPLVIVSHGYPGGRYLLSHLGENLASKGYVVVSIDHKDSTYDDQKAFASTLYNRPLDQLFVLDEMERLGRAKSGTFLEGLVDASRSAIVGYSMGGYGVLNTIGAGFSQTIETRPVSPPNRLLAERGASNPAYSKSIDPRIKAAIAIAPWGMQEGVWDADGLKGIRIPVLFVAGSADEVSGYEKGARAAFLGAVNADRYLLTFIGANHNAGAPIPAPVETYLARPGQAEGFLHYADPVWDTARMNNILDHFATAFLGRFLKGEGDKQAYLDLVPNGRDGVFALDRDGKPLPTHTYWKGFKRRTAPGLVFEHLSPSSASGVQSPRP